MKARTIELKSFDFMDDSGKTQSFKYRDGINMIVGSSLQGMTTDDVLKAVQIKSDLKKANGTLQVSLEDYSWILRKVNTATWIVANEAIAQFITDVRNAPEIEMA